MSKRTYSAIDDDDVLPMFDDDDDDAFGNGNDEAMDDAQVALENTYYDAKGA